MKYLLSFLLLLNCNLLLAQENPASYIRFPIKKMAIMSFTSKTKPVCFSKTYLLYNISKLSLQKETFPLKKPVQWLGTLIKPNYYPAFVTARLNYMGRKMPSFRFLSLTEFKKFISEQTSRYICFNYIFDRVHHRNYLSHVIEAKSLERTLQNVSGVFDTINQLSPYHNKETNILQEDLIQSQEKDYTIPSLNNNSSSIYDKNRQPSDKTYRNVIPDLKPLKESPLKQESIHQKKESRKPITKKHYNNDSSKNLQLNVYRKNPFIVNTEYTILSSPDDIKKYIYFLLGNNAKYVVPVYNKAHDQTAKIDAKLKYLYPINTQSSEIHNIRFFSHRSQVKLLRKDRFSPFLSYMSHVQKNRPLTNVEAFNVKLLRYIQSLSLDSEYSIINQNNSTGIKLQKSADAWDLYKIFALNYSHIFKDLSRKNLYIRYDLSTYFFNGYNISQFIVINEEGESSFKYAILNKWKP